MVILLLEEHPPYPHQGSGVGTFTRVLGWKEVSGSTPQAWETCDLVGSSQMYLPHGNVGTDSSNSPEDISVQEKKT